MPAANHKFYLRHCYLQNDLSNGRIVLGGKTLDLKKVTIPIYELASKEDHSAPARSVFTGAKCFGGLVRYVIAGSGHIAGVVNPPRPSPSTSSGVEARQRTTSNPGSPRPRRRRAPVARLGAVGHVASARESPIPQVRRG